MTREHVPRGIRIVTLARSVRWFGWGLCETLIPVVLFSFAHSYAEAGLFRSVYDIVFLISLPVVGALADRMPAKRMILFALAVYPLVGICYFLAGAFGAAALVVAARALNGVLWCCDSVGGDTYLRRLAHEDHLSKNFGYLSALPNFAWMAAALGSLLLIPHVPIHWLFLAIAPTALGAYFILRRAPEDVPEKREEGRRPSLFVRIAGLRVYGSGVWTLAGLTFFVACLDLLGTFFLPLFAYSETEDLTKVVLVTVLFAVPSAFAFWIGSALDRLSKERFIVGALASITALLGALSVLPGFAYQAAGIFVLGVLEVALGLALQALVTRAASRDHFGRVGGIMAGADELAAVAGPIAIGFLADAKGMGATYGTLAIATAAVAAAYLFFSVKRRRAL
jgi:MFS family permease